MKTKKLIALLAGVGVIASSFVGCASKPETQTTTPEKTEQGTTSKGDKKEKPVEITAMIAQSRNYEGLQAMIKKLKEEENISIDLQIVPDDQYITLMKLKVNSGEAPDLIDGNIPGVYYDLEPSQFLVDLSDESWVADLVSPDNVKYKDGKIYGYPFQSVQGVLGFIYNKDVFDAAGVSEPESWDDLLKVCEDLKASGVTPIHVPNETWVPQIYMTANFATALGGDRAAEVGAQLETNQVKWNEIPEFAEVLDRYLGLFSAGYVNDDFTSANYDATIEAVGSGKAAMAFCGDFFANSVMEAFPDANLGMFNASMTGDNTVIAATTQSIGFVASKDSKNLETVRKVFELWSTPEYGNLYYENRPGFPALASVNGGETPSYLEGIKANYIDTGKTIEEFNTLTPQGNTAVQNHLWLYYLDAPAKGNMTGQDVLEKFQGDFFKYMTEQQYEGF